MMLQGMLGLKNAGFRGFESIKNLKQTSCDTVPDQMGVYAVLKRDSVVAFRESSIGGHFKGKNPTVSEQELKMNWVSDADILYFGKAGGSNSKATLRKRLKQYMRFGSGMAVGHWGGRLIWQLENCDDLIVAWKTLDSKEPRDVEKYLLSEFVAVYGQRPFANLTG